MSLREVREWYADQQRHYVDDGVAFFWNDEGETTYYTFHHWNEAERRDLVVKKDAVMVSPNNNETSPSKRPRFFSLNRAFTPGMARLGAAAWTGDIAPTFEALRATPGMILGWSLASMPYVASDIGGFTDDTTPLLLTRWYWLGVVSPVMRIHSTLFATPHFPWLFGEPFASSMRRALDARYALIPYHYSLAHAMRRTGRLWMRPYLAAEDAAAAAGNATAAWLDGDLLVAPVLDEAGTLALQLPAESAVLAWFKFSLAALAPTETYAPEVLAPGATVRVENASLDDSVLAFAPAGTILVLGPPGVQSTDDLLERKAAGAALRVHVYAGADATFVLHEDDGWSTAYLSASAAAADGRSVTFAWDDASRVLSLAVADDATEDAASFSSFVVDLFDLDGSTTTAAQTPIADGASVAFASSAPAAVPRWGRPGGTPRQQAA